MKLRIFVDLSLTPEVLEMLQEGTRGHELVFPRNPVSSVLAKSECDPEFATVHIAFGQPDLQAIGGNNLLQWIHVSSSGITRYDNPEFRALAAGRKIAVSNSASVYSEACADHCLGFMLAQARNLPLALKTRTGAGSAAWIALRESATPLRGKRVMIFGYGAIGKRLVELLRPYEMNVIAYRRKARGDEGVPVITRDQLPHELAKGADHIVNILPDSHETRHFFNTDRLSTLKPGAVFYNIGRGTTVDQEALLEALRSGRLKSAWLDVTEPEPLPDDHPLLLQPNCFISPHVAGGHTDEIKTLVRHFLENFERFVRGESLRDRVM